MKKENLQSVNVDDLLSTEEIDKKFEMMSAECAKEMAKNYGAPNAFVKKDNKQE